ncbi:MAG: hypothetical protein DI539_20725 [Flavobacterium psychrophilum]|nr:MAG: hypothetical protein DI539_20725 [Flavobacterium psychrophilum]
MQDLLKEEEFIKPEYNPWKLFIRFYIIAVAEILIIQGAISFWFIDFNGVVLFIILMLAPLLTQVLMFTSNNQNFFLERKVKIQAVTGLVLSFAVPNFIINMIKIVFVRDVFSQRDAVLQVLANVIYCVIMVSLSLGLIYMISSLVKRKSRTTITE